MNARLWLVVLALTGATPSLIRAQEVSRDPASATVRKKRKSASPVPRSSSGADREEGWILRKTSKGVVKVPRKQTFVFEGSDVSGAANRPSQTVLGQRPVYQGHTLIPERNSFRKEFYEASGYAPSSSGRSQ